MLAFVFLISALGNICYFLETTLISLIHGFLRVTHFLVPSQHLFTDVGELFTYDIFQVMIFEIIDNLLSVTVYR